MAQRLQSGSFEMPLPIPRRTTCRTARMLAAAALAAAAIAMPARAAARAAPAATYLDAVRARIARAEAAAAAARGRVGTGRPAAPADASLDGARGRSGPAGAAIVTDSRWEEWGPPSRSGHSLVRDAARGRLVAIGGERRFFGRTSWVYGLGGSARWSPLEDGGTLPADAAVAAAAGDPDGDRIIALVSAGSPGLEAWTLPLAGAPAWSPIDAAGDAPPAPHAPAIAFDEAGRRLFALDQSGVPPESLTIRVLDLDPAPAWRALPTAGTLAHGWRFRGALAWDPVGRRLLAWNDAELWSVDPDGGRPPQAIPVPWPLYGSVRIVADPATGDAYATTRWGTVVRVPGDGAAADVLVYDGFADPHGAGALAWDPAARRLVHHAGWDSQTYTAHADLLAFAVDDPASVWTELPPGAAGARLVGSMVVDPARDRLVLYGGGAFHPVRDTLVQRLLGDPYGAVDPFELAPGPRPPLHRQGLFIRDPLRDRAVLLGGYAWGPGGYADVNAPWALSLGEPASWTPLDPAGAGPEERFVQAGCYDPIGDRLIVFARPAGELDVSAWALSLSPAPAWTSIALENTGPGFDPSAAWYDPVGSGIWAWHYGTQQPMRFDVRADRLVAAWPAADSPFAPLPLDAFHFDPVRRRVLVREESYRPRHVMSGFWSVALEETPAWAWHASAGEPPYDRYSYASAYDPSRDRIVLHGGYEDNNHYFDDWWALSFDRPTPVLASLVSARLENGMARLEWHLSGGTAGPLAVERARQGGAWETAAGAVPDGDGVVRFEDAGVAPGARIGFRLRVTETSGTRTIGEAWLEAPDAASFALRGAARNPVAGDLDVAFALDRPGHAEIELLDLQGRRIATRSLAGGAGEHRLRLAARGAVAPGMYFIRLRQDERTAVTRVAVVR